MMVTHDPSAEISPNPITENVKIGDHSEVLPSSDNTMDKPSNPHNVIIDEIIPHTEAS